MTLQLTTVTKSDIGSHHKDIVLLLETVLKLAVEMMKADSGIILLREGDNLSTMAAHNIPTESADKLTELSSRAVNKVLSSGAPLLTHDAQVDPRFGEAESIIMHQITSIICVPMYFEDDVIGVIYLDSRRDRQHFTEDNFNFVNTFARMAAIAVDYARNYSKLYREKLLLYDQIQSSLRFEDIIGKSPKMQDIFKLMHRVMNSDITVLLEGESGTGKELVAKALHFNGPRRDKPFVAQFCGNLAESLLESELFGHKKGSFTGAIADKKGLFEIADGGTFFLDEIADISPTIQTKLLRVVQEGEIRRVGDTVSQKVNVRIISATNKNLKDEVDAGNFREDLFYRLNVITIRLPALNERIGDIPLLVNHYLKMFSDINNVPVKKISPKAMEILSNYHWPGNVRELLNTIERAVILAEGEIINADDLFIPDSEKLATGRKTLKEHEKELVLKTLEDYGNNKTKTAELLGVSLRWLHYKLNEWKK
ncbi:MAG: sigma 54-interacting transcriptional regulator [Candidatus Hatepunaea meridiana]|nr:sigma 54-interacting transcriptional regulator [Candidatus Hatepunaea meridiana]